MQRNYLPGTLRLFLNTLDRIPDMHIDNLNDSELKRRTIWVTKNVLKMLHEKDADSFLEIYADIPNDLLTVMHEAKNKFTPTERLNWLHGVLVRETPSTANDLKKRKVTKLPDAQPVPAKLPDALPVPAIGEAGVSVLPPPAPPSVADLISAEATFLDEMANAAIASAETKNPSHGFSSTSGLYAPVVQRKKDDEEEEEEISKGTTPSIFRN